MKAIYSGCSICCWWCFSLRTLNITPHCLPASMVSETLIEIPLYPMSHFVFFLSTPIFLCFSLVFKSLAIMSLGIDFFEFILLRFYLTVWNVQSNVFKFCSFWFLFHHIFSAPFSPLLLGIPFCTCHWPLNTRGLNCTGLVIYGFSSAFASPETARPTLQQYKIISFPFFLALLSYKLYFYTLLPSLC